MLKNITSINNTKYNKPALLKYCQQVVDLLENAPTNDQSYILGILEDSQSKAVIDLLKREEQEEKKEKAKQTKEISKIE